MILTKYEHACFTLEKDGKLLVIDPGIFTTDIPSLENVVGIVVTHEHADHFDVTALGAIVAHSPNAIVYAHQAITNQLGTTIPNQLVHAGEQVDIGPFGVAFMGGDHAVIHRDFAPVPNLSVLINDSLYYPGDSYFIPKKPVRTLALPVAAPWMKLSEALDFLVDIKPQLAFPIHDAILSDSGKQLADSMATEFAKKIGTDYRRLSEPLTIDG